MASPSERGTLRVRGPTTHIPWLFHFADTELFLTKAERTPQRYLVERIRH